MKIVCIDALNYSRIMIRMDKAATHDNLHWLLLNISLRSKQGLIKIAESHGLTAVQIFTLLLLEPDTTVPMHSISGLLSCDPSNVTAIVDKLLSAKYIHRRESPDDRRIKAIGLTSAGVALRAKILRAMAESDVPDMKALSQTETKTLKAILLKIVSQG